MRIACYFPSCIFDIAEFQHLLRGVSSVAYSIVVFWWVKNGDVYVLQLWHREFLIQQIKSDRFKMDSFT